MFLSFPQEAVLAAHNIIRYSWGIFKKFLVILKILYILFTLLLNRSEVYWNLFLLSWGDCTFCSYYYYVQRSYTENILNNSEVTVHNAHYSSMNNWVFLNYSYLFCRDSTYCSLYYHVQLSYFKLLSVILWRQKFLLTLLLCTTKLFWKCS